MRTGATNYSHDYWSVSCDWLNRSYFCCSMDIPDYLLINRNLPNTQNGCEETLFRKTSERNEPSSSMYKNTLKTFIKDDTENVAFAPSKVTFQHIFSSKK